MSLYPSRGSWFSKVSFGARKRPTIHLVAATDEADATARDELLVELVRALRASHQEAFLEVTCKNVATFPAAKLPEIRAYVLEKLCSGAYVPKEKSKPTAAVDTSTTFRKFAERWTSGELAKDFPDYVKRRSSSEIDAYRLEKRIYPVIGDLPLRAVTLTHAKEVLRKLPAELSTNSRRHYAQLVQRVFSLAVWPAEILTASPIPKRFLPGKGARRAGTFLYPAEDAQLLAAQDDVPLVRRMLYGFTSREGGRKGEFATLKWRQLDLEHGRVYVDENKEGKPKDWDLDPGVVRALTLWRDRFRKDHHEPDDFVFTGSPGGEPINPDKLAAILRADLVAAKVDRAELHDVSTPTRMRLRYHDLRATFVVTSLVAGRTRRWIKRRTGHGSDAMIDLYDREDDDAGWRSMGELLPLDRAIHELTDHMSAEPAEVSAETKEAPSEAPDSSTITGQCEGRDLNSYALRRWYLKPVRLPIPPPSRGSGADE